MEMLFLCLSICSCVLSPVTYKTWTCMKFFFIATLPGITLKLIEQPIGGGEEGRGFRGPISQGAELPHILVLKKSF